MADIALRNFVASVWFHSSSDLEGRGSDGAFRREPADAPDLSANADPAEQQLLAEIRAGNTAAFETLYRDHYLPAAKFAFRFVQSRDVASELAQDVFMTLWERRALLETRGAVRTYILSAVRRRAIDWIRHEQVARTAAARAGTEAAPLGMGERPVTPEQATDATLLHAALLRVLNALPERQRTAFTLRWEQGLNNREIARALDIGEAAVSRLLSRAAEALMKVM